MAKCTQSLRRHNMSDGFFSSGEDDEAMKNDDLKKAQMNARNNNGDHDDDFSQHNFCRRGDAKMNDGGRGTQTPKPLGLDLVQMQK